MGKLGILFAVAIMASMVAAGPGDPGVATGPLSQVNNAVNQLCKGLRQMLPIAAMLGIVLAGVIYAAGQMMGAETRARANVWATAALTGALIAIMMAVVGPAVLGIIYNGSGTLTNQCVV